MFTPLPPTIYEDTVLETSRPVPSTISIVHPTPVYPSSTDRSKLQLLTRKLRREKRRLLLQSVFDRDPQHQPKKSSPSPLGMDYVPPRSPDKTIDFKSVAQNFKRLKLKENNDQRDDDPNPTTYAEQPLQENNGLIARARAA